MLKTLSISNVALIERVDISFAEGLNVLSGETGAGKSVILDSLDFVLGAKADRSMIRHGQTECSVRAEFSCEDKNVNAILEEYDIQPDDTLVISRKLNVEGKGAIKLNGCAVTVSMLRRLTTLLVDVHGQSEHFFLLKESNQLALLDKVAGVEAEKQTLSELIKERKNTLSLLEQLGGDEGERTRRMDILRYQIEEIQRVSPQENEEEELLSQRNLFYHAEKILDGLSSARCVLDGNGESAGGLEAISTAQRSLSSLERFDEKYGALAQRLEEALSELSDVSAIIGDYLDELDFDEAEQERVENRLDELKVIKKKYGGTIEEVRRYLEQSQTELQALETAGERREELFVELENIHNKIYKACQKLTEKRKKTAVEFTKRVTNELKTLNIASARFEIEFQDYSRDDAPNATYNGLDEIKFLFSANAGEPLKEMGKIISGGEMSRFMLAMKAVYAGNVGTCVFDEIDAGIGGKTAWAVAEKFSKIASHTQVIAVSHLAQIASFADNQFLIEKCEEGGKTFTKIECVEGEERRKELARILSGDCSEISLSQADELLAKANFYKKSISE